MPEYTLQWKDPDYCEARTGERPDVTEDDPDWEKLRELGCGEYIAVVFNTDTMTTHVVPRKKR